MRRDNKIDEALKEVLFELDKENENKEEQFYQEFINSGDKDVYLNESFRINLLQHARDQNRNNHHGAKRRRWFFLIAAALMLISGAVAHSAGYNIIEFIYAKTYTAVKILQDPEPDNKWNKIYTPLYIPPGYYLHEISVTSTSITSFYLCNNTELMIRQYRAESVTFDRESDNYEDIIIGSDKALYIEKGGVKSVYIYLGQYSFLVRGEVSKDELISIVKGLA